MKALREAVELNPPEPMKRGTMAPYLDMAALPTSGSSPDKAVSREFKSGTRFRNLDTLLARINSLSRKRQDGLCPIASERNGGLGVDGVHSLASNTSCPVRIHIPLGTRRRVPGTRHQEHDGNIGTAARPG